MKVNAEPKVMLYEALTPDAIPGAGRFPADAAWEKAERATGFTEIITGTGPACEQTVFSVLYDRENLYLRIECREPDTGHLKLCGADGDVSVSAGDCIELFLDTQYDRLTYYHFVSNPAGDRYAGRRYDGSFHAPWHVTARIGDAGWFLDIIVPFSSLGVTPSAGDVWGLNVCRARRAGGADILSCWSETEKQVYRGFHVPGKFGLLLFGGARACVKAKFLPAWQTRMEEVAAEQEDALLAFVAPHKNDLHFPGRTEHLRALYEELEKQPRGDRIYKYPLPAGYRMGMADAQAGWIDATTVNLKGGLKISLSRPVLIARSKGFLWFPSLFRMDNGKLMATMSNVPDAAMGAPVSSISWSPDGGLTWLEPRRILSPQCPWLKSATGELVYHLHPRPGGLPKGRNNIAGGYLKTVHGTLDLRVVEDSIAVTGWPRPISGSGFSAWNRQTVALKDGGYLATVYGYFEGASRYSVVAAESVDGRRWNIRSVIADENCELKGGEGPCETGICRLKDGRLMCVFRVGGGGEADPYGQCWSDDEGKTWTRPAVMLDDNGHKVGSAVPNLAVLKDGAVALFGGRPGNYLWMNGDGTGGNWQPIAIQEHHSALCPEEPIEGCIDGSIFLSSTCNNDLIVLDETHLLLIYDRVPHGWNPIPSDSPDTNSVWVVRVGIARNP